MVSQTGCHTEDGVTAGSLIFFLKDLIWVLNHSPVFKAAILTNTIDKTLLNLC